MNPIFKLAATFFVGWYRMAALAAIAMTYAWYRLTPQGTSRKFFMGPDEHRQEAEMLRRERPNDTEARNSAIEHEQVAKFMEAVRFHRAEFWWLLFFPGAMFALYALVHWHWPT